jgi:hypothetical protein
MPKNICKALPGDSLGMSRYNKLCKLQHQWIAASRPGGATWRKRQQGPKVPTHVEGPEAQCSVVGNKESA